MGKAVDGAGTQLHRHKNQTLSKLSDALRLVNGHDMVHLYVAIGQIPSVSDIEFEFFSIADLGRGGRLFHGNSMIQKILAGSMSRTIGPDSHTTRLVVLLASMKNLRHLQMGVERYAPFAPVLESPSSKLETLVITHSGDRSCEGGMDPTNYLAIIRALRTNSTLRELDIAFPVPVALREFTTMLRLNNCVRVLRVDLNFPVLRSEQEIRNFYFVLKDKNQSLVRFHNYGDVCNLPMCRKALGEAEMLSSNLCLEHFRLLGGCEVAKKRRNMYLRLNEKGRKIVERKREATTKTMWVDQLIKHATDDDETSLERLLYYLSTNPAMYFPFKEPSQDFNTASASSLSLPKYVTNDSYAGKRYSNGVVPNNNYDVAISNLEQLGNHRQKRPSHLCSPRHIVQTSERGIKRQRVSETARLSDRAD